MTTEQKAAAYDRAIKIAKEINNEHQAQPFDVMTRVFPELKENKMEWIEKIRQELKSYLEHREVKQISESDAINQWIAWLEKQGKQKLANSYCQKNCKGFQETGKCFADGDCKAKREAESAEWSKEDRSRMNDLCHFLEVYGNQYYGHLALQSTISWLKSLRPQKEQEWDQKDKNYLKDVIGIFENWKERTLVTNIHPSVPQKYIDWFKSFIPQKQWKPTEEQMNALNDVISSRNIKYDVLSELWKDLKQL